MFIFMKFTLSMLLIFHLYLFSIRSYFLSSLMVLQAMVLTLLLFAVIFSFCLLEGLGVFLFILTLSVCEAALGLTLLISLVKLNGNDLINTNSSF
uniref:NADH dehydrogenase subunit 4L n=1 Tax=Zaptyx oxypomatica TaxID=1885727 RepID=A0A224ABD4_9EUPU|nr:NADH dehydrogenase subunit 4L [Zaptyx oxypomatica]